MTAFKRLGAAVALVAFLGGCAYSGVAATDGKAVIAKNNGFLFGIFNEIYVCKITDSGVSGCKKAESP